MTSTQRVVQRQNFNYAAQRVYQYASTGQGTRLARLAARYGSVTCLHRAQGNRLPNWTLRPGLHHLEDRESAVFLGAGRAALPQLAHPWVAAALAEHSSLLSNPIARFHNTFRAMFAMVFGTVAQAFRSSRHLYSLHTRMCGELPESVGRYQRHSRYEANEVGALRWVFATLVETGLLAYESVLLPLTAGEREKYYAESKTTAALLGIPAHALPSDWRLCSRHQRDG